MHYNFIFYSLFIKGVNTFSLRDKKKTQTRVAIIQSAKRLFAQNGYEQTTMEQIAEDSIVSTGTLYNYYASKGDILLAIMAEHAAQSLTQGEALSIAELRNPLETLSKLGSQYAAIFLSLDSKLMAKSVGLALENPLTMGQRLFAIDRQLIAQVQETIKHMQKQDCLDPALDTQNTAYLLYSMVFMSILLSYAEVLPAGSIEEYIKRQVNQIISPWLTGQAKKG